MNDTMSEARLEAYLDAVAAHLAGARQLSDHDRRELLDDLATHLAEVAAEHESGSLEDRLGPPADYARELLASAGVDTGGEGPAGAADRLRRWMAQRADRLGAPDRRPTASARLEVATRRRLRDVSERPWACALLGEVPGLTPAWWALRGWLLAWVLALLTSAGRQARTGLFPFVPPIFGSVVVGVVLTALLVLLSMREGRQNQAAGGATGARRWARRGVTAICLIGAVAIAGDVPAHDLGYTVVPAPTPACLHDAGEPITDVHPYDRDGHPLTGVHLYDQRGRPLTPCPAVLDRATRRVPGGRQAPANPAFPLAPTVTPPPAVPPEASSSTTTAPMTTTPTTAAPPGSAGG